MTGFTLGLISSFHCMGMCGPLALALPVRGFTRPWRVFAVFSYHTGRILMYTLLGLICGLVGHRIYVAGFQQGLSIALGIVLLLFVLGFMLRGRFQRLALVSKFSNRLLAWMTGLWTAPAKGKFFLLGMGNGLLPCGMVYLAIAAALGTFRVNEGVGLMMSFGMGTLPALLALTYFHQRLSLSFRNRMRSSIPILMAVMGILLVLRGLNLGIPFISPMLAHSPGETISCH